MKRALILDLDNTIYPISSISEDLFAGILKVIDENSAHMPPQDVIDAKDDMTRRNFHLVADTYNFGSQLKEKGISLLKEMTYTLPMQPFEGYEYVRAINLPKFLVTLGFTKLQWSKVKMLDIEADFAEIHIVDPELSTQTKKDVFAGIMNRHGYTADEVLVIGDDPESEIRAATALGIDTFLFDPENKHPYAEVTHRAKALKAVELLLSQA